MGIVAPEVDPTRPARPGHAVGADQVANQGPASLLVPIPQIPVKGGQSEDDRGRDSEQVAGAEAEDQAQKKKRDQEADAKAHHVAERRSEAGQKPALEEEHRFVVRKTALGAPVAGRKARDVVAAPRAPDEADGGGRDVAHLAGRIEARC